MTSVFPSVISHSPQSSSSNGWTSAERLLLIESIYLQCKSHSQQEVRQSIIDWAKLTDSLTERKIRLVSKSNEFYGTTKCQSQFGELLVKENDEKLAQTDLLSLNTLQKLLTDLLSKRIDDLENSLEKIKEKQSKLQKEIEEAEKLLPLPSTSVTPVASQTQSQDETQPQLETQPQHQPQSQSEQESLPQPQTPLDFTQNQPPFETSSAPLAHSQQIKSENAPVLLEALPIAVPESQMPHQRSSPKRAPLKPTKPPTLPHIPRETRRQSSIEPIVNIPILARRPSVKEEVSENDKQRMLSIVEKLTQMEEAEPFRKPVDLKQLKDYLTYVKQPMDFSTVRQLILSGKVTQPTQLHELIKLICLNCYNYNQKGSFWYNAAKVIDMAAVDLLKETFPILGHLFQANLEAKKVNSSSDKNKKTNTTNVSVSSTTSATPTQPVRELGQLKSEQKEQKEQKPEQKETLIEPIGQRDDSKLDDRRRSRPNRLETHSNATSPSSGPLKSLSPVLIETPQTTAQKRRNQRSQPSLSTRETRAKQQQFEKDTEGEVSEDVMSVVNRTSRKRERADQSASRQQTATRNLRRKLDTNQSTNNRDLESEQTPSISDQQSLTDETQSVQNAVIATPQTKETKSTIKSTGRGRTRRK